MFVCNHACNATSYPETSAAISSQTDNRVSNWRFNTVPRDGSHTDLDTPVSLVTFHIFLEDLDCVILLISW